MPGARGRVRALALGDESGGESVVLAFDCIARMDILGNAYLEEISYTHGELARVKGVGGVPNATLTTLAL